jgi:hypothetical protein
LKELKGLVEVETIVCLREVLQRVRHVVIFLGENEPSFRPTLWWLSDRRVAGADRRQTLEFKTHLGRHSLTNFGNRPAGWIG